MAPAEKILYTSKHFIIKHKFILLVSCLYFLIRLINLTLLPIFNDESIYLHWAWHETRTGDLYYSLYDAKQPFLMWFFGIFENIVESRYVVPPLWVKVSGSRPAKTRRYSRWKES